MGRERVKIRGSIGLLWACALLPWLRLRSFIWEENTNAVPARDIVARGDWLHRLLHDVTFIEKLSLLRWLIAAVVQLIGRHRRCFAPPGMGRRNLATDAVPATCKPDQSLIDFIEKRAVSFERFRPRS